MARLYLLNLQLNICIDNDILSSCEAFSLTEMINYSWWYKIQKPRETCKVILKIHFTLISQNKLFISMQSLPFSSKQVISVCCPLSYFSREVTSKNFLLVSCFVKSNFCWQLAEIRLPYHCGSIYAK